MGNQGRAGVDAVAQLRAIIKEVDPTQLTADDKHALLDLLQAAMRSAESAA